MHVATSRSFWLFLLLVGLLACDRIGQDVSPADANGDETELFALPVNKVAFDLTTLSSLQTTTTFTIARQPQSGTLSFAANGLLLYEPNSDFVAGNDDFSVSATQQGVAVPMPLTVKMAADDDAVPCVAGALPDQATTPVGQSVGIDVLKNDKVCDGNLNSGSLKIVVKPKSGTVRIDGETVVYTPISSTFTGRDEFIYKICSDGGSNAVCYVAPVLITVGNPGKDCQVVLHNDQVNYRQLFVTDSLIIPALANDQLCQGSRLLPISITKGPAKGTAYTLTRSSAQTIVYKPNPGIDGTDNLTYQRCVNGACQQATVNLRVQAIDPACKLAAKNDQRTASLSTDADAKAGRLQLPVLLNDQVCSPITTMRILDNPSNLNLKIRNGVIVYVLGTTPSKGTRTFTYELVDLKGNRTSAQVKLILTS